MSMINSNATAAERFFGMSWKEPFKSASEVALNGGALTATVTRPGTILCDGTKGATFLGSIDDLYGFWRFGGTVHFRFKVQGTAGDATARRIFQVYSPVTGYSLGMAYRDSNTTAFFQLLRGGPGNVHRGGTYVASMRNVETDVVMTWDLTTFRVYVNGTYVVGSASNVAAQFSADTYSNLISVGISANGGLVGEFYEASYCLGWVWSQADINAVLNKSTYSYTNSAVAALPMTATTLLSDVSGHGNAAATSTATKTTTGRGYSFDGGDVLTFAGGSLCHTMGGNVDLPFTFACLIRADSVAANHYMINKTNEYYIRTGTGNTLLCQLVDASAVAQIGRVTAANALQASKMTSVICTYDGSKVNTGIAIYIDGKAVTTTANNVGTYAGMENTGNAATIGNAVIGTIFESHVFGIALSPIQVADLHLRMIKRTNET